MSYYGSLIHASSDKHTIFAFPLWNTSDIQAFRHPKRGAIIIKLLLYLPANESGVLIGGYLQYTSDTFFDRSNDIIFVIKAGKNPVSFESRCIPWASYTESEAVSLSNFTFLIPLSISVFKSIYAIFIERLFLSYILPAYVGDYLIIHYRATLILLVLRSFLETMYCLRD